MVTRFVTRYEIKVVRVPYLFDGRLARVDGLDMLVPLEIAKTKIIFIKYVITEKKYKGARVPRLKIANFNFSDEEFDKRTNALAFAFRKVIEENGAEKLMGRLGNTIYVDDTRAALDKVFGEEIDSYYFSLLVLLLDSDMLCYRESDEDDSKIYGLTDKFREYYEEGLKREGLKINRNSKNYSGIIGCWKVLADGLIIKKKTGIAFGIEDEIIIGSLSRDKNNKDDFYYLTHEFIHGTERHCREYCEEHCPELVKAEVDIPGIIDFYGDEFFTELLTPILDKHLNSLDYCHRNMGETKSFFGEGIDSKTPMHDLWTEKDRIRADLAPYLLAKYLSRVVLNNCEDIKGLSEKKKIKRFKRDLLKKYIALKKLLIEKGKIDILDISEVFLESERDIKRAFKHFYSYGLIGKKEIRWFVEKLQRVGLTEEEAEEFSKEVRHNLRAVDPDGLREESK